MKRTTIKTAKKIDIIAKRKLTVSRRMVERTGDRYTEIPAIILSGRWLEQAGFEAGRHIEVHPECGRLTITLIS